MKAYPLTASPWGIPQQILKNLLRESPMTTQEVLLFNQVFITSIKLCEKRKKVKVSIKLMCPIVSNAFLKSTLNKIARTSLCIFSEMNSIMLLVVSEILTLDK